MTPFILDQHRKDCAALRELRDSELGEVAGGYAPADQTGNTVTVTPGGDGGMDGAD